MTSDKIVLESVSIITAFVLEEFKGLVVQFNLMWQ